MSQSQSVATLHQSNLTPWVGRIMLANALVLVVLQTTAKVSELHC